MARWTIAAARQRLPALFAAAAREPQRVYRRNKLVAGVVSPALVEKLENEQTVAEAFAELRRICAEENYEFPVLPPRTSRPDPFARPKRKRTRKTTR